MLKNLVIAGSLVAASLAIAGEASAHKRHGWKFGHGHHYGHGYHYGHKRCFWVTKKFYGHYGPYFKKVRICRWH